MSRTVARYRSSRRYPLFALLAVCGATFCYWSAAQWGATWYIAAGAFALAAACGLALAFLPRIEIHESHLQIGRRVIFWTEIRRLDRTNWSAPLVVRLTLADNRVVTLVHPGDSVSATGLLRHLCRYARVALLDGVPYNRFWGDHSPAAEQKQLPPPRYRLLRPEDEDEVERMFQSLRAGGSIAGKSDQDGETVDQSGSGER